MTNKLIFAIIYGMLLGAVLSYANIRADEKLFWIILLPLVIIGNYQYAKYYDGKHKNDHE